MVGCSLAEAAGMSGPKYTEADYEKVMAMPAERYSPRDVERATGVSMSAEPHLVGDR
jgi:hypothetical protein